MSDSAQAMLLVGTAEPITPPRVLRAGPLSAELENGNLRYISYAGFEMIRAISFLVRGRVWNTFAPEIADLTVREDGDAFRVRYTATIRDGTATLSYRARIDGTANGTLSFTAEGHAESDFVTCRAGFVVLHPIAGVAGHDVEIEHVDGRIVAAIFPALIDPVQPDEGSARADARFRSRRARHLPHGGRHVRDGGPAQLDRRLLQDLRSAARSTVAVHPCRRRAAPPIGDAEAARPPDHAGECG